MVYSGGLLSRFDFQKSFNNPDKKRNKDYSTNKFVIQKQTEKSKIINKLENRQFYAVL